MRNFFACLACFSVFAAFFLTSCIGTCGGTTTFSARRISKTPQKIEKTVKIEGHTFTYFNVYNDGEGNFVLADESSYIKNCDLSFGVRFQPTAALYHIQETGAELTLAEPTFMGYDNGDYGYQVFSGFVIKLSEKNADLTDVSIGKITHWC